MMHILLKNKSNIQNNEKRVKRVYSHEMIRSGDSFSKKIYKG